MHTDDVDLLTRTGAAAADGGWSGVLSPLRRLHAVVMVVLALFWTTVVVIVIATFALTAWSERGGQQRSAAAASATVVNPDPRPAAVPPSAQMVDHDFVLGDVADVIYFFRDARCVDGLLTLSTTKAAVYAETACGSLITPDIARRLGGQPVRVRLVGTRLFVEALFVGSFPFDIARVWVEMQ